MKKKQKKEMKRWINSALKGRVIQKERSKLKIPKDMENFFDATVLAMVMVETAPNKLAKETASELAGESGSMLTDDLLRKAAKEVAHQLMPEYDRQKP